MGLFGFLEKISDALGKNEPFEKKDRRCTNCTSCWWSSMDREYKCNNFWAPQSYKYNCRHKPNSYTDCPKFDAKNR
ncbi:MAG: hypothetical protein IKC48_03790 [Clostridia bacterium]|nr:hypothetical protein [Clostridiales bacterium]MBR2970899.1 hypothetical protein [Clostridia bacterium]